jgi:hypothetical protein
VIPDPTGIPAQTLEALVQQLRRAVHAATQIGEMWRDDSVVSYWRTIYASLHGDGRREVHCNTCEGARVSMRDDR